MAAPVSPPAPVGHWFPVCGMLLDAEVHQNRRFSFQLSYVIQYCPTLACAAAASVVKHTSAQPDDAGWSLRGYFKFTFSDPLSPLPGFRI